MITLRVEAVTGHYRVPGNVSVLGHAPSFRIAPFSTVRGFIESLCGQERGWFTGKVAYGWAEVPTMQGTLLRKASAWSSSTLYDKKALAEGKIQLWGETPRPIHVPTLFHPKYLVVIDASPEQEAMIRKALAGDVEREGVLCLGESDDFVSNLEVVPDNTEPAQWVSEGSTLPLIVKSGDGYDNYNPIYRRFALGSTPAWVDFSEIP